jgi:tetratricopeptide (TPR) repeat protein
MTLRQDLFEALSLDQKALVNNVCERFEHALTSEDTPRVEDHLAGADGPVRSVLLRELLLLECVERLRRDDVIREEDLLVRFPGNADLIGDLVCQARRYAASSPDAAVGGVLPAADGAESPRKLGRFVLKRPLSSGGFATVYLAEDPRRDGPVALKVPHLEVLLTPALRRRFVFEAEAATALEHPHIVQVIEAGEMGFLCYLASRYVPGTSLAAWLRERKERGEFVPIDSAARLVATLARAMQHAHERGVLHCDLKPGNVLLAEGPDLFPIITDFGLARLIGVPSDLSQTGQVLGTPAYMAPEQARGRRKDLTPRSDVWALGAILYELLAGVPPFAGASPLEILHAALTEDPLPLRPRRRDVPADLEAVCLKCLEKEPQRRYPSAETLADDLDRFLRGEPIRARAAGAGERLVRWCRRRPVLAGLAGALLLALAGACAGTLYHSRTVEADRRETEAARHQAEENLATARQVLSELARVGKLPPTPEFDAQRQHQREALLKAEAFCRHLLEGPQATDEDRMALAEVCGQLDVLSFHFGDFSQAERAAKEAVTQWEDLARRNAGNRVYELGLAKAHQELGHRLSHRRDFTRALAHYRRAHSRLQTLARGGDRAIQADLFSVRLNLAERLVDLEGRQEARELLIQSRDQLTRLLHDGPPDPTLQELLAQTQVKLSLDLEVIGQAGEARQYCREARDLYRQLLGEQPHSSSIKYCLANCCELLARGGPAGGQDYAEAARLYEEAGRDLAPLAKVDPTSAGAVWSLGGIEECVARCHEAAGQFHLALEAYRKSVNRWEGLARKRPADPMFSYHLLTSLALLAKVQAKLELRDDTAATARQIAERIDQFARIPAGDMHQRGRVAWYLTELAPHLRRAGRDAEAHRAAERARQLYQELVEGAPEELSFQVGLSRAWREVSKFFWSVEDHSQVLHACKEALEVQRRVVEKAPLVIEYRAILDDRHFRLERALDALGRREEVLSSVREREKLWAGDTRRLRVIAADLRKLAGGLGPEEQRWKDCYLAESARLERRADNPTQRPGSGGSKGSAPVLVR